MWAGTGLVAALLGTGERAAASLVDGYSHYLARKQAREAPTGRLVTLRGRSRIRGPGDVRRFSIAIEDGLRVDRKAVASKIERTLFDSRGWRSSGIAFRRVIERAAIKIVLVSPRMTDRLCAPMQTRGRFSCHNDGFVVLNVWRWRHGSRDFEYRSRYREYLVNHEVGHALGRGHLYCARAGARAPVMMPQTEGVGACMPNPWPLGYER
ncbi:MAG: DUF3152 domain-containing protein [Actinomycetota bacterium]|nr:DUF3152 domain-containing protein [Actinomycetota bacterium]